MTTKAEELRDPESTWNKSDMDEPLFIIRPQDRFAIFVINTWIGLSELFKVNSDKIHRAITLRNQVSAWQGANTERMKLPD